MARLGWIRGQLVLLALILAVLMAPPAVAATSAAAERRVALVIGNSTYAHASVLVNPRNDAEAMAAKLRHVGFDVVELRHDLGRAEFIKALQFFTREARSADMALIFYAGHGIELAGRNFLIPVDAKLATDDDVEFESVPLDLVLRAVEGAKRLRLVILDACRNNPFATRMIFASGRGRSVGRGLAGVEPAGDMLVAYAARDGQVAEDGIGGNSPYTKALLQHIGTPGLEIQFLFRKVRDAVQASTGNRQQPHLYGSLGGDPYYLVPPAPEPPTTAAAPPIDPDKEIELAFWRSIDQSRDIKDFEEYLRQFPNGRFAGLARNRKQSLEAAAERQLAALTPPAAPVDLGSLKQEKSASDEPPPTPPAEAAPAPVTPLPAPEAAEPKPAERKPAETPTASPPPASPPPAPPPPAPLPAARPQPAVSAEQVLGMAREVPCSVLEAKVDGNAVTIRGHALKSRELDRMLAGVRALEGVGKVGTDINPLESYQCPPLDLMAGLVRQNRGVTRGLTLQAPPRPIRESGALRVDRGGRRSGSFAYVDVYSSDGRVRHLVPRPAPGPSDLPADGRLPLDQRVTSAPFGSRLVVAMLSPVRLQLGNRPEIEPAETYLAALAQALDQAKGSGGDIDILAEFALLRIEPSRPAVSEAPPKKQPSSNQAGPLNSGRCGDILLRAQLGEPLSNEDRTFLRSACGS